MARCTGKEKLFSYYENILTTCMKSNPLVLQTSCFSKDTIQWLEWNSLLSSSCFQICYDDLEMEQNNCVPFLETNWTQIKVQKRTRIPQK